MTTVRLSETQFRNKVTWFSFLFSLLVVWAHSYNAVLFLGDGVAMEAVYQAEHWIGDRIGQIAVPGFFMISAYLFYRDFTWETLKGKWYRRIKSVLVPFILWNFLYYLGYVIGSRLPWMQDVVGKGVIPFNLETIVDAVIHYRYNYVFWYLHQLMLLILLAPVLYPLLKGRISRIVFQGLLWVLLILEVRLPFVNTDALIYYSFAASLALAGRARRQVVGAAPVGSAGSGDVSDSVAPGGIHDSACLAESVGSLRQTIIGLVLMAAAAGIFYLGIRHIIIPFLVLSRLLAVVGLWLAVSGERLPETRSFMRHNFFLYATHFAFVRLINKGLALVISEPTWEPFVLYLLMPGLVLVISSLLGRLIRRISPLAWSLLNGQRV